MDSSDLDPISQVLHWTHTTRPQSGISIGLAIFAYTAEKALSAFQWGGANNPKNFPLPLGICTPSKYMVLGFLG